jgi:AbrB family looped-hinge helix DNA binding protein
MELEKMREMKAVTITNRGMVTIPAVYRKAYHLKDGDRVWIIEDEGTLRIIPIKTVEELRQDSYTAQEMLTSMEEAKREDLELENK